MNIRSKTSYEPPGKNCAKVTGDFEVLVVNDGSRGSNRSDFAPTSERTIHICASSTMRTNRGYGAALISGFQSATRDLIFYTDGDGQYDVREIHNLMAQLRPGIDLVNGYKVRRADGWHRVLIGEIYRRAMRWAFHLSIRDVDCDFRLFRRRIFRIHLAGVPKRGDLRRNGSKIRSGRLPHGRGSCQSLSASAWFQRIFPCASPCTHVRGLLQIWWNLVLSRRLLVWFDFALRKDQP